MNDHEEKPLSQMNERPEVYDNHDCNGCGRRKTIIVISAPRICTVLRGRTMTRWSWALCAPCLRALVAIVEEHEASSQKKAL